MLEANELAFLDKHDAKSFAPPQLLDCIHLFEDLLTGGAWQTKWKRHEKLFDLVKDLKSSDEAATEDNNAII